jgi:hypothetical protein
MSVLALAAAMAGGLGALLLVVAAEYFGDRVRDGNDLADAAQRPLLGTIDLSPAVTAHGEGGRDQAVRRMASRMVLDAGASPVSLAVVPIDADDGSALAARIAQALTDFGKRVTVVTDEPSDRVGARATRDGVRNVLGAQRPPQAVLREDAQPRDMPRVRTTRQSVLAVLGAQAAAQAELGLEPPEPDVALRARATRSSVRNVLSAELAPNSSLSRESCSEAIGKALKEADFVIVASQSLATSSHGLIWSSVADSTILVSRERGATRNGVRHAAEALSAAGATIIGVVEVRARDARRGGLMGLGERAAGAITSPLRRSR